MDGTLLAFMRFKRCNQQSIFFKLVVCILIMDEGIQGLISRNFMLHSICSSSMFVLFPAFIQSFKGKVVNKKSIIIAQKMMVLQNEGPKTHSS